MAEGCGVGEPDAGSVPFGRGSRVGQAGRRLGDRVDQDSHRTVGGQVGAALRHSDRWAPRDRRQPGADAGDDGVLDPADGAPSDHDAWGSVRELDEGAGGVARTQHGGDLGCGGGLAAEHVGEFVQHVVTGVAQVDVRSLGPVVALDWVVGVDEQQGTAQGLRLLQRIDGRRVGLLGPVYSDDDFGPAILERLWLVFAEHLYLQRPAVREPATKIS